MALRLFLQPAMPSLAAVRSRSFGLVIASRDIVHRNTCRLRFVKHAMDRSSVVTSDFCSVATLFIERVVAFVSYWPDTCERVTVLIVLILRLHSTKSSVMF